MEKNRILAVIVLVFFFSGACYVFAGGAKEAEDKAAEETVTITIATVNNPDMKVMEELSPRFTEETGIKLNWLVLPENELRQKVTEDIALGAGKFDIVTIGIIEVKTWVNYKWIVTLDPFFKGMDAAEKKPTILTMCSSRSAAA